MSLYSALYAGVSGLSAQAGAMATVADNITNINTVGYKEEVAQFKTLVSGGKAGTYAAGGVASTPQAMISKQGVLQASASQTDLGIQGAGFFVARDNASTTGTVSYTRSGSFTPNKEGYLANSAGYYLQGWRLDSLGKYVNNGSLASLTPVRVNELTGTAAPSTKIDMRANLQSTTATFGGPYAVGDLASGTTPPDFSRPVTVYDAQGGSHAVTLGFLKTGTNTWASEIYAVPATDVTAAGGVLASGTVVFNPDGSLNKTASTPALFGTLAIGWTNGAGSIPIQLNLGSNGGLDGLTQFGGSSAMISSSVDGGMLGNVSSIKISETGTVSAVFDDGTSRAVFQLPLATFQNPDGLTRLPGNSYGLSDASGNVAINSPGSLGAGSIVAGNLEASTVDLAQEFTNMIRFQRAYSASSKIITTVDEMLQEVSALKR